MHKPIYFWKDGQVCKYHGFSDADAIRQTEFMRCFAVDTSYDDEALRYGKYLKNGWSAVPLHHFPPEFRTHLLLLGVT